MLISRGVSINLPLNSKAGQVAVPAGVCGTFTANKNTTFAFGPTETRPGDPAVYHLPGLPLNRASRLLATLAFTPRAKGTLPFCPRRFF